MQGGSPDRHVLADFNAAAPKNKAGNPYGDQYGGEGGHAKVTLVPGAGIAGGCLRFEVTQGKLYAEFNAHNADGSRGFAREYAARSPAWEFNRYNRLEFWMKNPVNGAPLASDGTGSLEFGTYMKKVRNADTHSDEAGGGHWYHILNIPNTGTWTRVILNTHPHHFRGREGGFEEKNQAHPTGEADYGYLDALTRFYINETHTAAAAAPIVYDFDEFAFYREPYPENDEQVYSIAATYVPAQSRFILTWSRNKDENAVKQEVRYAYKNIHEIGWAAATPAPGGILTPPGWQGYNGMIYAAVLKKAAGTVYFAIKPQNSELFSQISIPVPRG